MERVRGFLIYYYPIGKREVSKEFATLIILTEFHCCSPTQIALKYFQTVPCYIPVDRLTRFSHPVGSCSSSLIVVLENKTNEFPATAAEDCRFSSTGRFQPRRAAEESRVVIEG